MNKTPLIIITIVVVVALFFVWYSAATKTTLPEGIVLFYGDGCPHCKNVDDFISQNKIEDKIKITRLEVWNNKSNADQLGKVAVSCNIDVSKGVGVPFLYDGKGKCYVGDVDTINFFKNEAGIK